MVLGVLQGMSSENVVGRAGGHLQLIRFYENMSRLAIFIDGGYLDKIAEKEFGIFIDYEKISGEIRKVVASTATDIELLRTFYYNCLPYQSNPPTPNEALRFSKRQGFYDYLSQLRRFEVRRGRLAFRGLSDKGEPIFEQKKVDLMLGLDLALLSGKQQINHVAIVTGDGDLLPAFEVAKTEGILVWLFHGPRCSKADGKSTYAQELWLKADERYEIDLAFMQRIQKIH